VLYTYPIYLPSTVSKFLPDPLQVPLPSMGKTPHLFALRTFLSDINGKPRKEAWKGRPLRVPSLQPKSFTDNRVQKVSWG
jgi:hypothetical protein